jgi:lysophospholipase L1-like esterase
MGRWTLGLYQVRFFLFNVAVTYLILWVIILLLTRPDKTVLGRIVVVHLALCAVLFVGEMACFLGWIDFKKLLLNESYSQDPDRQLRRVTDPFYQWEGWVDPDLVTWLGIDGDKIQVNIETDAHGLRNPSGKRNPEILCLGDSILVATLIPIDQTVTERMQAQLGREVWNVSELGSSPQESLLRLESVVTNLESKLVLHFVFEGNDLVDSMQWRAWCDRPGKSDWPSNGILFSCSELLKKPSPASRSRSHYADCSGGGDGSRERVYFYHSPDRVEEYLAEMKHIGRAVRDAHLRYSDLGANYAVVFVPMKYTVMARFCEWPTDSEFRMPPGAESEFLNALRAELGQDIPLFDATQTLVIEAGEGRRPYFAKDTHLNSIGHDALARALAPWVKSLAAE